MLNVAGPRVSKEPRMGEFVMSTLGKAFTGIGGGEGAKDCFLGKSVPKITIDSLEPRQWPSS